MIADTDTAVLHLFLRYPADHPKSVQQPEHRRKNVQDQPLYEPVQRTFGVKHSDQGAVCGAAF